MRNTYIAVIGVCLLTACASRTPLPTSTPQRMTPTPLPPVQYQGGDGSSVEKAVVIANARNEAAGIRAEYDWLRNRYPGYVRRSQSLLTQPPHFFDALQITLPDGSPATVYFDISGYFGRS